MAEHAGDRTLVVPDVRDVARLADDRLIALSAQIAGGRRLFDAAGAVVAAELARRSHRDLGHSGLAQRTGARTPERLVASVTGLSVPESRAMISAGEVLGGGEQWLAPVAEAVQSGEVSVGAGAAIRAGLGEPSGEVDAEVLEGAARRVLQETGGRPPEQVARRAREVRDELDDEGVADRQAALRAKRFLRLTPQDDGMTRIFGLLDPESAALVTDAFDLVTAPRRGGPRFVRDDDKARAQQIIDDPRTTEQLTHDAFVEMVRIAGAADDGRVFGVRKPAVRVHVTASDLDRRRGSATIEGQSASVSAVTAERIGCAQGFVPLLFDGSTPLDLGRTQRLFSEKQRVMLAAIWGGCARDGCDRPPSWTEAHHIDEWERDDGKTDLMDGVLLCRHCHARLHELGGRIVRRGAEYVLEIPGLPPEVLVSKNPVRRKAARAA